MAAKHFRLIGNTTVFRIKRRYSVGGCIPCVVGVTPDGRLTTTARDADVIFLD